MTSIWRQDEIGWSLLAPVGFPDERTLHDLVEAAPHALPLSGSPRLVIVGREVRLGNGYADLVAIEPIGRICVIEVKLASNAESRRAVVSQILAYAAYLHGLTPESIERDILVQELRRRGHDNLVGALSAHDQTGSFQPDDFTRALADNLASGSFRLVLVLDQAPDELVRLVGYLEAVTEGLVIDLITVSRYEVDGKRVMVPQRVDPERRSGVEARPGPVTTGTQGYLERSIEGMDTFVGGVSEKERPTAQMLLAWAVELEREGVARLATWHGKRGKNILVWLLGEDAGLVTLHFERTTTYVQLWRTVFEDNAPRALVALDALSAPAVVGQGSALKPLSEGTLALVRDGYREASDPNRPL